MFSWDQPHPYSVQQTYIGKELVFCLGTPGHSANLERIQYTYSIKLGMRISIDVAQCSHSYTEPKKLMLFIDINSARYADETQYMESLMCGYKRWSAADPQVHVKLKVSKYSKQFLESSGELETRFCFGMTDVTFMESNFGVVTSRGEASWSQTHLSTSIQ